jgi:hypothetical protein
MRMMRMKLSIFSSTLLKDLKDTNSLIFSGWLLAGANIYSKIKMILSIFSGWLLAYKKNFTFFLMENKYILTK